jgi:hypothetical protein
MTKRQLGPNAKEEFLKLIFDCQGQALHVI